MKDQDNRRNRWHMNRMGFVHFWLYDHEIFPFENGKLLLRGQNASGKSITTQSFIPFILDGDRTPSRLDPFGSSDRRMEYYFLTEGGPDDVTGYLFLEFKREETEEYRTIGIGQRAQRGKTGMAFWGFVILDGRRVGIDLNFYKEAGGQYIPLSRLECKNLLGDRNFFTDMQGDYMREVNRQLFGFPRIEQYRQFVNLLIKVRAPKLSKEFKPSRTYEILNDSLQTLTDEDLRAMVDAMEKMDEIEGRLESLRNTYKDLGIINREYTRYNQYMLWKKARAYLEAHKKAGSLMAAMDVLESELEDNDKKQKEIREDNEKLTQKICMLENEIDVWRDSDVRHAVEEKLRLETQLSTIQQGIEEADRKIRKFRDEILRLDGVIRELDGNLAEQEKQLESELNELNDINEVFLFPEHEKLMRLCREEPDPAKWIRMKRRLQEIGKRIQEARERLREYNQKKHLLDQEEERLHKLYLHLQACIEQEEAAAREQDFCKDELIEQWYRLKEENQELIIGEQMLQAFCSRIRDYSSESDRIWIEKEVRSCYEKRFGFRKSNEYKLDHEVQRLREQKEFLETELAVLKEQREEHPTRRPAVEAARKRLSEHGITCIPFYQAVEFAKKLPESGCDLLELQLSATGILDSLIIPRRQEKQARELLAEGNDILLVPEQTGEKSPGKFDLLYPSEDLEPSLADRVKEILTWFSSEENGQSAAFFSPNGHFRYGLTEGWLSPDPDEKARFIGREARERRKQELILRKEEEISLVAAGLAEAETGLTLERKGLERLDMEYGKCPDLTVLELAFKAFINAQELRGKAAREHESQLSVRDAAAEEVKQAEFRMLEKCRDLPYERTLEAYEEVIDAQEEYRNTSARLETLSNSVSVTRNEKLRHTEKQENLEDQADETDRQTRQKKLEKETHAARLSQITALLDNPENRALAERMELADRELKACQDQLNKNNTDLAVFAERQEHKRMQLEQDRELAVTAIQDETFLRDYFLEEMRLKLIDGFTVMDTDILQKDLISLAQKTSGLVREGDRQKTDADMITALHSTFSRYSSSIGSYGAALEDCFGDTRVEGAVRRRQIITAAWKGKKLPLPDFTQLVKGAIEDTELLIQQKDRELFEKILADTLSTKLAQRISESREWIRDMSALMQQMDTSMGLSFVLKWIPRKSEEEGRLGADELEKLLRRDTDLMTQEDIGRVAEHFRTDIRMAKREAAEKDLTVNYLEMVRNALDYRRWFEFRMSFIRAGEAPKELTDRAFNRFSGGEKAMAMYVPLFSAVNAQYRKSEREDHPRMIALDEAFAGVDDVNIGSMFGLVEKLDFDYIMNSQALWGCYQEVKALRIAELLRPANAPFVTVVFYTWNGKERVLEENI